MPIARWVRHSPSYLYLKLYSLSLLVSLFASAPVSTRLSSAAAAVASKSRFDSNHNEANATTTTTITAARWIERVREVADEGVRRHASLRPVATSTKGVVNHEKSNEIEKKHTFAFALKTLASDADAPDVGNSPHARIQTQTHQQQTASSVFQRIARVLRRWGRRVQDMSEVRGAVQRDAMDIQRFPELAWQAHVRRSKRAHHSETAFVEARKRHAAAHLSAFLEEDGFFIDTHILNPIDMPTVAVGGSGGGYRAMYGFTAALAGLERAGAWPLITWLGGVSGSCWTIAGLYTIGRLSPLRLLAHYRAVAREGCHPLSRRALDVVARSRRGVYFLLAPLLAKARSRVVGVGIMDLYATMTTCYQLLSRSPHARPRLARSTFQFSKVWQRFRLEEGQAPLPVLSAVRVMHTTTTEAGETMRKEKQISAKSSQLHYQWWEATPLEVGSSDAGAWVPTWAYGRSFVSGRSVSTAPEISLALLLGQATSAPAGPLTGYISTLLATLPRGTIMSTLLAKLNAFVMHRRWQKRWGNPIRGADEPNPCYGIGEAWEQKGRIKLMDGGLSNNLPNHVFWTKEARQAQVIVSFDQSSDVQTGASIARLADFARERDLLLVPDSDGEFSSSRHSISNKDHQGGAGVATASDEEIRARFKGKYALLFRGWKVDKSEQAGGIGERGDGQENSPDVYLLYCPLLPHACQPDFDPVTSAFSTSYNLVWTSEQVETIAKTAQANVQDYVVPVLRRVMQEAYLANRQRRLAL